MYQDIPSECFNLWESLICDEQLVGPEKANDQNVKPNKDR